MQVAGFSIVRYNGAENGSVIGHGLSQKPEFIIMKEYLAIRHHNNNNF